MTEAEFVLAMRALLARGVLTAEQAAELVRAYRAGEIDPDDLPIPIGEALRRPEATQEERDRLLFILIILLGLQDQIVAGRLSRGARTKGRDALRLQFERSAIGIGSARVRAWHAGQIERVGSYALRQAMLGYGRPLPDNARGPLNTEIGRQLQYMYYFGWDIAARRLLGLPRSDQYIAHRAGLYQGAGWSLWHQYEEAGTGLEFGLIYQWISRDDGRTCGPCRRYHGTYHLAGQGPYPGTICEGAGACRCRREPQYNPEIYAELSGIYAPAG